MWYEASGTIIKKKRLCNVICVHIVATRRRHARMTETVSKWLGNALRKLKLTEASDGEVINISQSRGQEDISSTFHFTINIIYTTL